MLKTIFIIQGYEQKLEDGRLTDVITYEVYARNEKEAIKKAKSYVKNHFIELCQLLKKMKNENSAKRHFNLGRR